MEWNPKILFIPLALLLTKRFHVWGQKPYCQKTYFFEEVYKNILCWLSPVFRFFSNGTSPLAAALLPPVAKCQNPVQIPPVLSFFFLSQDFHSISHTAIFLIWFLVCGCTTHALHILLFVSVCICFNKAKLENVFSFSRYLILFCLNGPVCIFDAWKIKCNWGSQQ